MTQSATHVPIRPAATVVIIRDSAEGIEVLMVARARTMDFAAGALVFPGGKVTEADGAALASSDEAAGFKVAGIRETFEETGLLIVRRHHGGWASQADVLALAPHRAAVDQGRTGFAQLLAQAGLTLAIDALLPFAHIITPELSPKRFDTRFFLAALPQGQEALHDDHEIIQTHWATPAEVLRWGVEARFLVMPPTQIVLRRLAQSCSVADAHAEARALPPVAVTPTMTMRDGIAGLYTPASPGFEDHFEPASGFLSRNGIRTP
jgi:8-oxo-dGTP pyrophosphatase MutT (NUDIX family)